jgi:hypothetical protein
VTSGERSVKVSHRRASILSKRSENGKTVVSTVIRKKVISHAVPKNTHLLKVELSPDSPILKVQDQTMMNSSLVNGFNTTVTSKLIDRFDKPVKLNKWGKDILSKPNVFTKLKKNLKSKEPSPIVNKGGDFLSPR